MLNLSEMRSAAGLTQAEVAARAGLTQQMYNYVENGRRRPSVSTAKKIAAVLGFAWTDFFDDDDASA